MLGDKRDRSLKHRAGGLCVLISASGDGQIPGQKLLLDDLPSADLLLLVDRGLSVLVNFHVGKVDVHLLHLSGVCEPLRLGLPLVCEVKVGERGCGRDGGIGEAVAGELSDALEHL